MKHLNYAISNIRLTYGQLMVGDHKSKQFYRNAYLYQQICQYGYFETKDKIFITGSFVVCSSGQRTNEPMPCWFICCPSTIYKKHYSCYSVGHNLNTFTCNGNRVGLHPKCAQGQAHICHFQLILILISLSNKANLISFWISHIYNKLWSVGDWELDEQLCQLFWF